LSKKSSLPILVALIGLAFVLRVHHLDSSPLRGDEAFAVRYWAAPPAEVLGGLAWVEPHPFGTFFGFWAWKSLVGSSEFAMRILPALINLLGVPTLYALGRRLFRVELVGLIAACLWAVNPNLIWHSQDVRNYAIWAALSSVSTWLMLHASDRSRRIDWALYVLVETITLYVFFLEVFIVAVHALYILLFRRKALLPWLTSMLIAGVLLLPWFGQLWALAHSGYRGTAVGFNGGILSLLLGEPYIRTLSLADYVRTTSILFALFGLYLLLIVAWCRRTGVLLISWLVVPAASLSVAATNLNVFNPRYLIPVTPAILFTLSYAAAKLSSEIAKSRPSGTVQWLHRTVIIIISVVLLGLFGLPSIDGLITAYSFDKAPDWYSLRDYLRANTTASDTVIMTSLDPQTGNADPAFEYYYGGPAQVITLPHPGYDIGAVLQKSLDHSRAVWFIVSGSSTQPINDALLANGVLISDQGAGRSFQVRQYRAKSVKPEQEIENRLRIAVGDALLSGYSILGERRTGSRLTVLLFWERLPAQQLSAFVHLIGPPRPNGSPLWTQDDHPPSESPGRDVYHLDLSGLPPGEYTLEIGLYDPKTGQRRMITDPATGKALGDSYNLTVLVLR
jgi:Dolichyl-phosphate-mannose-protein mannosyltransferase